MLEELKKFPYKNKNFRHLALEVIALKVVRLLLWFPLYLYWLTVSSVSISDIS